VPDLRRAPDPGVQAPSAPVRPSDVPPPRPRTSSDLVPPGPDVRRRQAALPRASVWAWTGSVLAGLVALAAAYADRAAVREQLTDSARAAAPGSADDLLRDTVTLTMLLVGSLCALLTLAVAACVLAAGRGRRRAATLLLVVGPLLLAVVAVAQAFVAGGSDVARIALLVQGGLLAVGLVSQLTGRSRRG
jgi:hypothetical protein